MTFEYSVQELTGMDGTALALHSWRPSAKAQGCLFYVHGIQSHAGWLFESGPELAGRGVSTFVLDRRGSGHSGGYRADLPSADRILDDYLIGLAAARADAGNVPCTVLGQSFGGSIVGALAARPGGLDADRLIYCTPALGQQEARHGVERLAELRARTGLEAASIGLADEDYTDHDRYLQFMANDYLMLRQITARGRATMIAVEESYMGRGAETSVPVHLVRNASDPIIALDVAERVLERLHGSYDTVTFPVHRHYIEFSAARREYWKWLAGVTVSRRRDPV